MRYENKRNGKVASLISEDSKFRTVLMEYEDGSTVSVSQSTLKRWWKSIPEEVNTEDTYIQEVVEQKKELGIECPPIDPELVTVEVVDPNLAGDGTSYSQVMQEIIADEKKAVKKKEARAKATNKKEVMPAIDVNPVIDYIKSVTDSYGLTSYTRDKQPGIINFKFESGPVLFYTIGQKKSLWLFVKSKQLGQTLADQGISVNCLFDRKFNISELTNETENLIDNVIKELAENKTQKKEEK